MSNQTKLLPVLFLLIVLIPTILSKGGQIPVSVLQDFATQLKGTLVLPSSPSYEQSTHQWNSAYDHKRPQAIVYCANEDDVSKSVALSLNFSASLSVRSGGHSFTGWAVCDGCLVLDLTPLNQVVYDKGSNVVFVQPGVRLIDFTKAIAPFNVTVPHGFGPTVGFGGFTQGGGVGLTHRRYGLTIDSLLSARVVLANASLVTASATQNIDLFWALRGGGGGNFGVVTGYYFNATPVPPTVLYVSLTWSYNEKHLLAVAGVWQTFFQGSEDSRDFGLYWRIEGSPFGTWFYKVEVFGVWTGDVALGRKVIDKFVAQCVNSSATPSKVDVQETTYDQAFLNFMAPYVKVPRVAFKVKSRLVKDFFPPAAFDIFAKQIPSLGFLNCFPLLWLDPLGGKVSDVSPTDTAFPHRSSFANLVIFVFYLQEKNKPHAYDWLNQTMRLLEPYLEFGQYVNFPDDEIDQWQDRYYGVNYPRLQEVKTAYDPSNFFSFPQSVETLSSRKGGNGNNIISIA